MAAAQPESKILSGALLNGKYRVEREIGRGGMAAVYEAEHIALGKKVAVKVLAAELSNSAIVIERFFREARAAASVKSPFIVEVYDSGRLEDGRPFIAMEYLEGESLYDRMARVRLIDPVTTVRVIAQCAKGLVKAHALGIVHRDLKPENIHLTKNEEGEEIAKILDFGLAKFYAPVRTDEKTARLTREGAVFGTPAYMSPEQVKGQGSVDHRADLWALGCMAFECLTGRPVWNTDQGVAMTFAAIAAASPPIPSKLRPDLPPAFDAWFKKALERDVSRRFQTAKELSDALAIAFNTPHISLVNVSAPGELERVAAEAEQLPSENVRLESERPPAGAGGSGDISGDQTTPQRPRDPALSATDLPPTATPDSPPPSRSSGAGVMRYVVSGLALGGALLGGYFAWTKVLRPQVSAPIVDSTASAPPSAASFVPLPTSSVPATPEEPKWKELIAEGQQLLATNDSDGAVAKFKEAQAQGGKDVAKAFVEQVSIGKATPGPCQMKGFSHPRVGYANSVGRPSVAAVPKGAIVTWTDDHESPRHDHAYSVLIDPAGRIIDPTGKNSQAPRDITPEADNVVRPALTTVDDRVVLLYWDNRAKDPAAGIRVRWLDGDGRIDGNSILVNSGKPGDYWPSIERVPQTNDFWVAWQEDRDKDGDDLFLRHLDPQLNPLGVEIRATDYVPPEKGKAPKIDVPSVGVGKGNLFITYALERDKKQLIDRMRIPLASPLLTTGLEERAPVTPQPGGAPEKRKDRELTDDVQLVNEDKAAAVNPSMACNKEGCFIVWHEPRGGAQAAMIDLDKGLLYWRKRLSSTGGHPAVAVAPDGTVQVVYYDANKVRIASLSRDTVGTTSTFARVSNAEMKRPYIAAGRNKGEWYVAWQDNEAGHAEAYVARLVCR